MSFPDKFLWGGSISAAQCEGAWDEQQLIIVIFII